MLMYIKLAFFLALLTDTIDLRLKIKYSSFRKGNISVVGKHSRRARIKTIW